MATELSTTYLGETMIPIAVEALTGDTEDTQCHFIFEGKTRKIFSYIPGESGNVTWEEVEGTSGTVDAWVLRLNGDETRESIVPEGAYKLYIWRGVLTGTGIDAARNAGYVIKKFRMPDSGVPFGPEEV